MPGPPRRKIVAVCCVLLTGAWTLGVPGAPAGAEAERFTDVTRQASITWQHVNGATPEKYLIETMGGGGAFLDFNRDGRLDIFLVQSGCHKFSVDCAAARNALYRQNPDGTFTDVAEKAGVAASATYGQGVAVADYDNDGFPDIYVTGFPRNVLYHNNGDGTFTDVTQKAGVVAGGWSTSAAFFDYNRDGYLDLYVGRYLEWDYDKNAFCGERRPGYRAYCHPDQFNAVASRLYRNNGNGTFTDVSEASGIAQQKGKALGVVAFDFNRDGWPDLYVANDAVRNFLFKNNGDSTFTEMAMVAEVAYGFQGKPQSGMGTDAADYDGDGLPDLLVTNIDYEPNNLYRNNGDDSFTDVTVPANLGSVALLYSGFGTRFVDFDNDGDLDMAVLNGHVLDNVHLFREGIAYAERPLLLENAGGRFQEVGTRSGKVFEKPYVGRALVLGDFDNDGDSDFLWVINGGPAVLVRNDIGNRNAWIGFELTGTLSNRDAIGAVVSLTAGGRRYVREVTGGSSYCAAHDLRLLFGLGAAEKVEKVEIRWPSGNVTIRENPAIRRYHRVQEQVPDNRPKPSPKPAGKNSASTALPRPLQARESAIH
ncbi:MAG: CRTAC1 family protein [Acidobacteria bacterium]|nr:CRTAC1 family protein [Acidobacteriota bacterium]